MDKTCFVLSPHAAPEPEPTYAGRAFVEMSPDRVVDYPLGLRSQGPEFKSPSGRFYRDATTTSGASRPRRGNSNYGDLSRRVARPEWREAPHARTVSASSNLRQVVHSVHD